MAIKKYYVSQKKDGLPYDKQKKKYFSWGFDIYIDGQRLQERGFLTFRQAEQAVIKKKSDNKAARHGIEKKNRPVFLSNLLQKKLDTLAGGARSHAKKTFKTFLSLLPKKITVVQLTTADIQKYVSLRQSQKIKNSTICRELVPLVSALNSAYIFYGELRDYRPPRIPRPKVPKDQKERVITQIEAVKILDYLYAPQKENEHGRSYIFRRRVGQFFQVLLLTCSRPGEIARLKPADIDFANGLVKIRGTKNRYTSAKTTRYLPLNQILRDIFIERIEYAKNLGWQYLFIKCGKPSPEFDKKLKQACQNCGIEYGKNNPDGVTFYTARHTGTTELTRSNQLDLKSIGAFTGHSDEKMTMYYSHVHRSSVETGAKILEEKFGFFSAAGEKMESRKQSENKTKHKPPVNKERKQIKKHAK